MYGILISIGALLALFYTETLVKRENLSVDFLWDVALKVLFFGLIGARLYHVIEYWHFYSKNIVTILFVWRGGLGIIGGIVLGGIVLGIKLVRSNRPTLKWLDLVALNIPLAQGVGRWGNIFNKELIPFAVYESFLDILLFLLLLIVNSKEKTKPGTIFFSYLGGYSIIRFALEPLKSNIWKVQGVSVVQAISGFVLFLSIVCYSLIVRRNYDLSSS